MEFAGSERVGYELMKRLAAALLITATATLGACGTQEPKVQTEAPISLNVDAPRVTLLDAGQGEKTVLKYVDLGSTSQTRVVITDGFDQGTGDAATLSTAPTENPNIDTFEALLQSSVSDKSPRDVSIRVTEPRHSKAEYQSDATSMDGFALGWIAQSSGKADTVRLAAPPEASDQGRALAELYLMKLLAQPVIFPSEPIGPGASWTVENRVTGDATMLRNTTYTLESLQNGKAELALAIGERPAITALDMADQGKQGELKVLGTESKGAGHYSIDLSRPLPTTGSMTLNTRVTYGETATSSRVFQDFHSGMTFS